MTKLLPYMPPLVSKDLLYSILATEYHSPLQGISLPVNHGRDLALQSSVCQMVFGFSVPETCLNIYG